MSEKKKVFAAYKAIFAAAFTLLLLGAIIGQIGNYVASEADIEYRYDYDSEGYKDAEKNALLIIIIGNLFIIIGGIVLAMLTFNLALEPDLIESENVRAGLLIFVALILAFVAVRGGTMLIFF